MTTTALPKRVHGQGASPTFLTRLRALLLPHSGILFTPGPVSAPVAAKMLQIATITLMEISKVESWTVTHSLAIDPSTKHKQSRAYAPRDSKSATSGRSAATSLRIPAQRPPSLTQQQPRPLFSLVLPSTASHRPMDSPNLGGTHSLPRAEGL